jgi:DNA-binding transcriptional LysR family regulator
MASAADRIVKSCGYCVQYRLRLDLIRKSSYGFAPSDLFSGCGRGAEFQPCGPALAYEPAPLSQQIRLLEQEMGAQLFERSRRAVALTPAGLLLQDKARQIVELHQQAGELVRMAAHGLAGRLRIAFTASVPLFDEFSTMLRDFRSRHPQVELDLQHMTTGEQIAALTAGQIDIGFMRPRRRFASPCRSGSRRCGAMS